MWGTGRVVQPGPSPTAPPGPLDGRLLVASPVLAALAGPFPEGVLGSGPYQSKDGVRLGTSRPPRLPPCLSPFPDLPGHHVCAQDPRVSLPEPRKLV